MERLKQLRKYPILVLFSVFVLVFFIMNLIEGKREFSEMENRYLQLQPTPTVSTVMSGKFMKTYETYINDQFVFRDGWISLKSRVEYGIGKQENNAIVFGKDHYLFARMDEVNEERLAANTAAVKEFFALYPQVPATFGVIPNSYMVLSQKVPYGLEMVDQYRYISQITDELPDTVNKLDLRETLEAHNEQYIYYMTDHHWTSYGAYLAYAQYVKSRGMQPVAFETLEGTEVPGFYGTYYSKAKLFNAVPDIITYYDIPVADITMDGKRTVEDASKNEVPVTGLYNLPQFEKRDKYAGFLYGNNGVTVIKSEPGTQEKERILVIKDSYSNSLVGFLTYNYKELVVVDLRAFGGSMKELMGQYEFDDILLLYNFENYAQDTNFVRLKY